MNVEAAAAYQITNNGRVVDSGYAEGSYDGHTADIIGTDGEKIAFMRLTNEDINRLLAAPASPIPLEERIATEHMLPVMTSSHRATTRRARRPRSGRTRKASTPLSRPRSTRSRRSTSRKPRSRSKRTTTRRKKSVPSSKKGLVVGADPVVTVRSIDTPVVRDTPGAHKE